MLRQAADELCKSRLQHLMGSFLHLEPLRLPLPLLPPGFELLGDFEGIHVHPAEIEMRGAALPVIIISQGLRLDLALYARLLLGLKRRGLVRLLALHGPALRDQPALGLAGCDEEHLELAVLDAEGERCDLAEFFLWRPGHSTRVGFLTG